MKYLILLILIFCLTACGAKHFSSRQVAQMLKANDEEFEPGDTFSCISEDGHGRKFQCIKKYANGYVAFTYEVLCDSKSCQYEEYPNY